MLEEKFITAVKKYRMLKSRDYLMVGVSGGPDSVALLHLLFSIKDTYKLRIVCLHFNHSLRKESDTDERFVAEVCRKLGVPFISDKKEVGKFFRGDSLEQTARQLRFDFFCSCSRRLKTKNLALAHNQDDVVETVLMRIIRGTALRGLRAIMPISTYRGLKIIRPLIGCRKEEILSWLRDKRISYRIDKTNFEDRFFRNRIRMELIPFLEKFNPNVVNAIFNLARASAIDYDFLYRLSREEFVHLKKGGGKIVKLNMKGLKDLDLSLFIGVIQCAIEEVKGNLRRIEMRHFEEVVDLIHNRRNDSVVHLPDIAVEKQGDHLVIKSLIL